jgi:hypothetical protein
MVHIAQIAGTYKHAVQHERFSRDPHPDQKGAELHALAGVQVSHIQRLVGTEGIVVVKDVLQLEDGDARKVKRWATRRRRGLNRFRLKAAPQLKWPPVCSPIPVP